MIRFRLTQLLRLKEERESRTISWKEVSEATGVSVSVLSALASPRGGATTNTRFVESLIRYFQCTPSDLLDLVPPPGEENRCHVDDLYPGRGAHR